mgnify:CR=1 FL=1
MCVCDIANVLNMTKSSISHQLSYLKDLNIVKSRKSGKEVYYSLDDDQIINIDNENKIQIKKTDKKNLILYILFLRFISGVMYNFSVTKI